MGWGGFPVVFTGKPCWLQAQVFAITKKSRPLVSVGDWFKDPKWIPKSKDAQIP